MYKIIKVTCQFAIRPQLYYSFIAKIYFVIVLILFGFARRWLTMVEISGYDVVWLTALIDIKNSVYPV
jgi:hypothetical protein